MKNKILPLSLVTLVIILGAFLISATVTFPESFLSNPENQPGNVKTDAFTNYLTKVRANQNTGIVDHADLIKAQQQANEIGLNAYKEDFEWNFLGPDNVGGYTQALLYDNTDETFSTIYAGAMSGGIYKSTNNGLNWYKSNGIENNLNVTCMAQASDGSIYVGTGGIFIGSGIYKSTDGENFTLLPSTDPYAVGGNLAFVFTHRLAINQDNGNIFASTVLGVWYSSDEGLTWNNAKTSDDNFLAENSSDINIGSNGIVAASVGSLCYISESGNPNQFELHSSDTFNLPYEGIAGLELAIAPSNPDILYASVIKDVNPQQLLNLYRSDDKGVNWRVIAPGGSSLAIFVNESYNALTVHPDDPDLMLIGGADMWEGKKINETGYFQWTQKSIGFFPPQIFPSYIHTGHFTYLFRPGFNEQLLIGHAGGISRGLRNGQFYEFLELNKTYTTSNAHKIGIGGFTKRIIGAFDQNGVQLILGDGNPAQAQNGNQIWSEIPPYGGVGDEAFISVIDPNFAIYSLDGGNFRRSEDLGENFSNSFLGTGMTFPDLYLAPSLYWENIENENSRDTLVIHVNHTIPYGTELWICSYNREYPFKYTTDVTYLPGDSMLIKDIVSTKLFIGSDDAVWMTTGILDFTQTPEWFLISNRTNAGFDGLASSMAMSSDANIVYVGTDEGRVYRIANISLAYNYERADIRSPYCIISTSEIPIIDPVTQEQNTQVVTSVSIDPQDPNNVIITLGNYGNSHYVFRATDALGSDPTFTSIQGNLPEMPIYASLIEMNNSEICIIGTEMGIYESHDISNSSPTWNLSSGIAGKVPVFDIKQQVIAQPELNIWYIDANNDTVYIKFPGTYNFGVIYTATYGRGLYYSNKYQKPVGIITNDLPQSEANIKVFPNPVNNMATIEYSMEEKADVRITVFGINGKLVIEEQISQTAGTHQYRIDCSSLPRGMYIVRIHTGKNAETSKFIVTH